MDAGTAPRRFAPSRWARLAAAVALAAGAAVALVRSPPPPTDSPSPPLHRPAASSIFDGRPRRVALDRPAVDLALDAGAACAALANGEVHCWGRNAGRFDGLPALLEAPARVEPLRGVRSIALASHHLCALDAWQSVTCLGDSGHVELGGGPADGGWDIALDIVSAVKAITASRATTCAITVEGGAQCWGALNTESPFGGSVGFTTQPVPIDDLTDIEELALGDDGLFLRDRAGEVSQLTHWARTADRRETLPLPAPARRIVLGPDRGCVLLRDGRATCWEGWLREGVPHHLREAPELSGAVDLALAQAFTCMLDAGGNVRCWPVSPSREQGDGGLPRARSERVIGVEGARRIVADGHEACALLVDGAVMCWLDTP